MRCGGDHHRETPRTRRLRRWLLAGDALPLSCMIALGAHAAVIAVGVNLRHTPEPPRQQILLARGWTSELTPATGDTQMNPGGDNPPILSPLDSPGDDLKTDLAKSRRDFDLPPEVVSPPDVSSTQMAFPAGGTSELGDTVPIGLAGSSSTAPPAGFRQPPPGQGAAGDSGTSDGTSNPTLHSDQSSHHSPGGKTAAPAASAGVPDGSIDASAVPITYPRDALRNGWSGFVRARFDVDARGRVAAIEIIEPDPNPPFNQAVTEGLRRWRVPRFLWNTSGNVLPVHFKPPADH
jgi:TonB family protein